MLSSATSENNAALCVPSDRDGPQDSLLRGLHGPHSPMRLLEMRHTHGGLSTSFLCTTRLHCSSGTHRLWSGPIVCRLLQRRCACSAAPKSCPTMGFCPSEGLKGGLLRTAYGSCSGRVPIFRIQATSVSHISAGFRIGGSHRMGLLDSASQSS